jgi:hypothetical protein
MVMNCNDTRIPEGKGHAYLKVVSWHSLRETEKSHENLSE